MDEPSAAPEENVLGDDSRIYEIGYHIVPTAKEEDFEEIVGGIRAEIERAGGTFISEGAPSLTRLAYPISSHLPGKGSESRKRIEHDRGYFGWIKFEASIDAVQLLNEVLKGKASVMRFIVFRTVREDTRAKMKAPTLREVKRTVTIRATPRRVEESAGPVSEAELEKALSEITKE